MLLPARGAEAGSALTFTFLRPGRGFDNVLLAHWTLLVAGHGTDTAVREPFQMLRKRIRAVSFEQLFALAEVDLLRASQPRAETTQSLVSIYASNHVQRSPGQIHCINPLTIVVPMHAQRNPGRLDIIK